MKRIQATPFRKWCFLIGINILTLILLTISTQNIFLDIDENTCTMTFMLPNYYLVPTNHSIYQLYYYREGRNYDKLSPYSTYSINDINKKFTGIPVLFIPGNSGSYKQIRSVGAEAYHHIRGGSSNSFNIQNPNKKRKVPPSDYYNELDIFTLNFEEELSALGGDVMYSETEYVNDCISSILKLYQDNHELKDKPTSVILIGHSMGGVVARMTVLLPNHVYGSVTTIITLNSSHRNAPVYTHPSTEEFYIELNKHWSKQIQPKHYKYNKKGELTHLPSIYDDIIVVSIAGGHRDTLIRSELTSLDGLVHPERSFSVITTSVPDVLFETDHQSILWCNEVVSSIVESLLLLASKETKQNSYPAHERLLIVKSVLHSHVPEVLGITKFQDQPEFLKQNQLQTRYDIDTLTEIAKKKSFESYSMLALVHKSGLSYKSNPRVRITTLQSEPSLFYFHFKISDWIGESNYFSLSSSLAQGDFSAILYSKDFEKVQDVTFNSFSYPPLHPLSKGKRDEKPMVEPPSTQLILTHDDMKNYHSLLIAFPKSVRASSFFAVAQFYNSAASNIIIPSVSFFGEHKFTLPIGHPIIMNFTLPKYTNKFPIKATLATKYLDFDNITPLKEDDVDSSKYSNLVINNLKPLESEYPFSMDFGPSVEDFDIRLAFSKRKFVDKSAVIQNNYPFFLPMSYQFIPQLMEEGKFVTNCTLTRVKFHQSTKAQLSHKFKKIEKSSTTHVKLLDPIQDNEKNQQIISKQYSKEIEQTQAMDFSSYNQQTATQKLSSEVKFKNKLLHIQDDPEEGQDILSFSNNINNNNNNNNNNNDNDNDNNVDVDSSSIYTIEGKQEIDINNPHLLMMLDPFYSYEITITYDLFGSIGTLIFSYAISIIPCSFGLFLWVFSAQLNNIIRNDKYPSLLTTLRDQSIRLVPYLVYLPIVICIIFSMFGITFPTLYGQTFPDPFINSFMVERIPPFWSIPILFITSVCILTILILVTNLLFSFGASCNKITSKFSNILNTNTNNSSINNNNNNNNNNINNNSINNNNNINNNINNNNNNINNLLPITPIGNNLENNINNDSLNIDNNININIDNCIDSNVIIDKNDNNNTNNSGVINSEFNNRNNSLLKTNNNNLNNNNLNNNNSLTNNNINNINNNNNLNNFNNEPIVISNRCITSPTTSGLYLGSSSSSTPKLNIRNLQFSSSKWVVIGGIMIIILHSALGLVAFLLFLLFSSSKQLNNSNNNNNSSNNNNNNNNGTVNNTTSTSSMSPLLISSMANSVINSGGGVNSINTISKKKELYYRQSIFLMYIFSSFIMAPNLIVWIKHLSFEWKILDSYELFIILAITHIFLSTIELNLNNLIILRFILIIISILVPIYCILFVYRMLYFNLILSFVFIVCHIWSRLKEKIV
ncbi:hypothetical protein DICPUDRAFT_37773 [Dictyostelium purpureum]|uniref:GPI inositol-deacylase n=1 Tax=Dictyostelium purpureum TaxID=5786 RepID=F0ZTD0_DICPU|nr:uncharacterized protein DICPUDRAFT_37773 [Dictyostelium purpureum]EGC32786.1 hypothetical protein DICPUDRAFT_37773 [Dictyostelium purpureum]|eukprot:XP_003290674.1 hypothetical protein DICPUDRAFT_37773 [Dictyostelium purpureum]